MAKEEDRVIRILYVMKILWEDTDEMHPMSASRIAKRMTDYGIKCERKAVYRYLEQLTEFGLDIVRTGKGTYLAARQFELPEVKLLVDAVQASKFITEKKSEELIRKLGHLVSRYDSDQLRRQVIVKNRTKTINESIYYNIDAIYEGIRKNKEIACIYWNWNMKKVMVPKYGGKRYVISPWGLIWEDEKYYLVGYDERVNQLKYYRIDKMRQITIQNTSRRGRELFEQMNLSFYQVQTFGMFQGKRETVILRMEKELAGVVIDRFGKEVWMHPVNEDYFTVTVDVMVSNQFYGWIAGLGGGAEIMGPAWVKEGYQKLLVKLMKNTDWSVKM